MPKIDYHRQFRKDLQRLRKSGVDMTVFEVFVEDLQRSWPLPTKYQAHLLHGKYAGIFDVHIRQNWVVFLKKKADKVILLRTGTHASLRVG